MYRLYTQYTKELLYILEAAVHNTVPTIWVIFEFTTTWYLYLLQYQNISAPLERDSDLVQYTYTQTEEAAGCFCWLYRNIYIQCEVLEKFSNL